MTSVCYFKQILKHIRDALKTKNILKHLVFHAHNMLTYLNIIIKAGCSHCALLFPDNKPSFIETQMSGVQIFECWSFRTEETKNPLIQRRRG